MVPDVVLYFDAPCPRISVMRRSGVEMQQWIGGRVGELLHCGKPGLAGAGRVFRGFKLPIARARVAAQNGGIHDRPDPGVRRA